MTTEETIEKITSGNTHYVWEASCAIIEKSQQSEEIFPLIDHLPIIIEKTKDLEMGGALAPNQRFVDNAIRIIEFYKNSSECSCELYMGSYDSNNPNKEQEKGNILIESTITGNWMETFDCKCNKYEQKFTVIEQHGGHNVWWEWKKTSTDSRLT